MSDPRHLDRAWILLRQGRPGAAEEEAGRHVAEHPEDPEGYIALTHARLGRGREEAALEAATRSVQAAPDQGRPYVALAAVEAQRGKLDRARRLLEEALRVEPQDPGIHEFLASIELALHHRERALAAAERGLELDATHAGCLNESASALLALGRAGEAEERLRQSLCRDPENGDTLSRLGWCLLRQGRARGAREAFRASLHADPGQRGARAGFFEATAGGRALYRWMLPLLLRADEALPRDEPAARIGLALLSAAVVYVLAFEVEASPVVTLPLALGTGGVAGAILLVRPLLHLFLRRHPLRWFALDWSERAVAMAVPLLVLWAGAMLALGLLAGPEDRDLLAAALGSFAILPPLAARLGRSSADRGWLPVPVLSATWIALVAGRLAGLASEVSTLYAGSVLLAVASLAWTTRVVQPRSD